jgi:Uma2 family endonuclease
MAHSSQLGATLDDFWTIPEGERFHEIIGGEIVPKATPSGEHGGAQSGIVGAIHAPFHRSVGRGGPGGWWIATEVEVLLDGTDIVRPDIVGWRRDRCLERPQIPHYWLVDPRDATLTVMRWSADGYVTLMRAERGEVVRPEPFHEIELAVGTLFGDDPPDR